MKIRYRVGDQPYNIDPKDEAAFLEKHPDAVLVTDEEGNIEDPTKKDENTEQVDSSLTEEIDPSQQIKKNKQDKIQNKSKASAIALRIANGESTEEDRENYINLLEEEMNAIESENEAYVDDPMADFFGEGRKVLEYKIDDDGRRMYYKDGGTDAAGSPIEPGYYREVRYDYDRSDGVRFEHDSYGKYMDNFAHNIIGPFFNATVDGIKSGQTGEYTDEMLDLMTRGGGDEMSRKQAGEIIDLMNAEASKETSGRVENWVNTMDEADNPFFGFFEATVEDPLAAWEIMVQSLSSSIKGLKSEELVAASTTVGGGSAMVGTSVGPWGTVAGFTRGFMSTMGGGIEATAKMGELIRGEFGGKMPTEEELIALIEDKERFNKLRNKALAKGTTIMFVDNFGGAMVSKRVAQVKKAKGTTRAVTEGFIGESITGGGGEALSSTVIGEKFKASDIGAEVLGNFPNAIYDVGGALLEPGTYKINGGDASAADITSVLETATAEELAVIDIEVENNNELANEVAEKKNDAAIETQIDEKIVGQEDRKKLVELAKKREKAEAAAKKKGVFSVPGAEQALADVDAEIAEIITAYEGMDGRTKEVKAQKKAKEGVVETIKEKAVKKTEEKLKKTIKFAEDAGKHVGKDVIVAESDVDAQAITDMAIDEWNENNPDNKIDPTDVAGADGMVVGNTIIINKDVSTATKQINVGGHETFHAITEKHLSDIGKEGRTKLIADFKNTLTKEQKSYVENIIDERNKAGENLDLNSTDEWLTIFSDGIEKGDITFNEGVFDKIANVLQEIFRQFDNFTGGKLGVKEFANGRQVYNFMKDYSKSIEKGKLSERAIKLAEGGVGTATVKESRSTVNLDVGKETLDKKIDSYTNDAKTKSEFQKPGGGFDNVYSGILEGKFDKVFAKDTSPQEREIMRQGLADRLINFDPAQTPELSKWMYGGKGKGGNIQFAKRDAKKELAIEGEKRKKELRIDAQKPTEEGGRGFDIADTTEQTEVEVEPGERVVLNSKLRRALGLDNDMKTKVRNAVIKTFGTKLPDVSSRDFVKALEKAFRTELKKPIQDMIGTRDNYTNFLNKHFEAVFNALPVETLIQMERNVKPENRIFTTSTRITKPTEVDALISKGKLPKNTNRLSGPQLHTKNKFPGKDQVQAFFKGIDMENILGYKIGASTLGTRKDKLAMSIAEELGFDATMEVVQQPEVQQKRKDILDLEGKKVLDNDIALIAKQIDRDPSVKFSKSGDIIINQAMELTDKLIKAGKIDDIFDLKTRKVKPNVGKYLEQVQDAVFKRWMDGSIIMGDNQSRNAIVKVLNNIPKKVINENKGTAVERHAINVGLKAEKKHPGFKMETREVAEGGIPDFHSSIFTFPFNIEIKHGSARLPQIPVKITDFKTGKFEIKYEGKDRDKVVKVIKKALKNGGKDLVAKLAELGITLEDSKSQIPSFVHSEISGQEIGRVSDVSETVSEDYAIESYGKKEMPSDMIEITGAGLYYLKDPHGIAAELGIPKLKGNFPLKARIKSESYKEGPKGEKVTAGYKYPMTVEPTITPEYISEPSPISIFDSDFFDKVMNTNAVKNLEAKQKVSKSVSVNKAKESSKKFINKGEVQGMSAFDFDETLIIDGKNFVVATDPLTGEKTKISSSDWPTKGTRLAAQGFEMNFDDFVNVRGGVKGPLFQKLLNRIEKFGVENNFILTARPQESAIAIHGWLKSKGVNIPLKNITGLGNSTGDAKAQWVIDKFTEGYNDIYFVDDALPNVKAVKNALNELDIKGSSVQAKVKFSRNASNEFNEMMERTSGVGAKKVFSAGEGRVRGAGKGKWDLFIPPSAEDFKGLMYKFLGKGKQGNADMRWMKDNLFDPFAKGIRTWNTYKQNMSNEYRALKNKNPKVVKTLNKKVKGTSFTTDTAIRTYLWNKNGMDIPGMAESTKKKLLNHVNSDKDLVNFAETLGVISRDSDGYIQPTENWMVQTIASDLFGVVKNGRNQFLNEWIENKNTIFSKENLNKIEATHGSGYRDALENILYRMETGTNRVVGKDKTVNKFVNWINGSVGAIMFLNIRSAALQTISMVNFVNWGDNNVFKSAKAFANIPQFSKDFSTIFNSDMLKQRRGGSQIDIAHSELADAFSQSRGKAESMIRWLLEKGFEPTRIADSFAISMGGATFYRNRIDTYIKNGMSKKKAENQAFLDFQEIAEETQQSSRPDLISGQQAGVLGRIILPFQNTPMQMTRLMKKAVLDLKNGRGDAKANISKIMYYGLAQNLIFGALQTGLMFALFGPDDEEKEKRKEAQGKRVLNGALDTILRGTGVYGAALATAKNTYKEWRVQREKPYGKRQDYKIMQEAINLSPPMGSKFRKIMNAIKTEQYNKGVGEKIGFRIENPNLSIAGEMIEGLTNFPMARIIHKTNNLEEAITGTHDLWQRVALTTGWNMWSVGVEDEELEQAKIEAKEERAKNRKIEKEKQKIEKKKAEEERKKKEGIKTVQCSGIRSNGQRCGLTTETKAKTWKCAHHMEFKDGMDRDGDGVKEYRCTAIKANGQRCNNKTENKNKKCYAHQ